MALSAIAAMFITGCAGHRESRQKFTEEIVAPRPPAFLVGPASVLLTNTSAFSARVTVDTVSTNAKVHELTGQLLGEGTHLLFAPTRGDRTFIWDTAARNGYILSEALQGYAPFSSPSQITKITTTAETAGPGSDRVNGHPGHEVEMSIAMNDGSTIRFSIWRASDLNDFPVRIKTIGAEKPFELNLLNVQPAKFPESTFAPPDGFTKYSNPEVMASELMARHAKPKNTESTYFGEPQPILKNSMPH
ncbi:MAG TPA: hypothetical protein VFB72_00115 [Verrucomicrobiae bacterium]|nr:hypothetical protein [Verrucomicrobiae bacterium]